jgi:hypothetical protein
LRDLFLGRRGSGLPAERVDRTVLEGKNAPDQDVCYLTGEIELKGKHRGKAWEAVLYIQDFIETVLERVSFKGPG